MERGPYDLRRPVCGTASQMRWEQQITSLTSEDWSAPGTAPIGDAPSAVVLEVSFMFNLELLRGMLVSLLLELCTGILVLFFCVFFGYISLFCNQICDKIRNFNHIKQLN